MEIASNTNGAEALRDKLLAEAGRAQPLGNSGCASGDTVPGDAQRASIYNQLAGILGRGADAFRREARSLASIAQTFDEADAAIGISAGR